MGNSAKVNQSDVNADAQHVTSMEPCFVCLHKC